jgi:hypothetical protein
LRALERFMRTHQVLPCTLAIRVGTLKIRLRPFAIGIGTQQFFLGALMISLRPLQILLRSFAIGLGALKFLLCPFTLAVRTLEIVVGGLPFGLGSLQISLRALQIGVGALALGVRAFEIRLHARPFSRDGLFQFASRLCGSCRRGLFRLASCVRDGLGQRAFDFSARGGHFRFQARPPLRVDGVQLRCPPLFGVRLGTLPRFLERLLVTLRQTPQMGVELSLKLGANGVNDAADWFLGH